MNCATFLFFEHKSYIFAISSRQSATDSSFDTIRMPGSESTTLWMYLST